MIQDIYPHVFDSAYVPDQTMSSESYVFVFEGKNLLLKLEGDKLSLPRNSDIVESEFEPHYLFSLDGVSCFWLADCTEITKEGFVYNEIRFLHTIAKREVDFLSGVALHLKNWYEQHRYCGKCGGKMNHKSDERAMLCPQCDHIVFPTISPAIIVAVICGDHILLAHGAGFREGLFSLLAGYVDVGEAVEQTIVREVKEEVGVDVDKVTYYGSQPWSFSSSLMIGFIAEVDEMQDITIDPKEIGEADWYHRDELPTYPPDRSIAGEIIDKFRKGML